MLNTPKPKRTSTRLSRTQAAYLQRFDAARFRLTTGSASERQLLARGYVVAANGEAEITDAGAYALLVAQQRADLEGCL